MWGKHVEAKIADVTRKEKDNRRAEAKIQSLFSSLFGDTVSTKGRFKDPAAMFAKAREVE